MGVPATQTQKRERPPQPPKAKRWCFRCPQSFGTEHPSFAPQQQNPSPPAPGDIPTQKAARAAFQGAAGDVLPGAGRPGGAGGGGAGRPRMRAGPPRRAERLTIYGQSWGRAARGAALPGSARPRRQRAGQGASGPWSRGLGPPPPRPARPAPPFGPFPGAASARSGSRRGRSPRVWRARRGHPWARMPYEISKCRARGPRGGARAAGPLGPRPSRGVGGSAGVHGRGGGARAQAHERRAALGGDPGTGTPQSWRCGPGPWSPRAPDRGGRGSWTRKSHGPPRSFRVAAGPPGGGNR